MTMVNQCIQATEEMVGQAHATKSDTLNRLVVGINNFRLIKSGANLTLAAVNGNLVDLNGSIYAVTTLPTLAPSGLTPDTTYYIYLYDNSGTATLEASETGYTVDSKGRANKTGVATRRLMGIARIVTGPAWADEASQRFVLSRDNRLPLNALVVPSAGRWTSSATYAEMSSSDRAGFLSWSFSHVVVTLGCQAYNTTAGTVCYVSIGVDGVTQSVAPSIAFQESTDNYIYPVCIYGATTLADGYHYATAIGMTTAGTLTLGAYYYMRAEVLS